MSDEQGRPLEIVPLPMPRALRYENARLPASYCNFYIANGVVIVPQFDDPADAVACETLGRLFPGRQIRPASRGIGLGARNVSLHHAAAGGDWVS